MKILEELRETGTGSGINGFTQWLPTKKYGFQAISNYYLLILSCQIISSQFLELIFEHFVCVFITGKIGFHATLLFVATKRCPECTWEVWDAL